MHRNTKVATCCYCGTRAALVLDAGRHELACQGCGAPLHELKAMPLRAASGSASSGFGAVPRDGYEDARARRPRKPRKPRKGKPGKKSSRKRKAKKLFEEAFDFLEDIFD